MGKSQSTQRSSSFVGVGVDGGNAVQQRPKKAGSRSSTLERPVSTSSSIGNGAVVVSAVPDPAKPNGSVVENSAIPNAIAVDVELPDGPAVVLTSPGTTNNVGSSSELPPATSPQPNEVTELTRASANFVHEPSAKEEYQKVVDQLLLIWPDFVTLRKIDVKFIDPETLATICDVFRRLIEQYQRIRALQDGSRDSAEELRKLREKCQETEQELVRRQTEIDSLKEAAAAAAASATRNDVVLRSTSVQQLPPADYDLDGVETDSGFSSSRQQQQSPPPVSVRPSSIYQPTAFVQAVSQQKTLAAGARTSGFEAFGNDQQSLSSSFGQQQLETTLERERRRVNRSDVSLFQPRTRDPGPIVERFRRLEDEALGKLFTIVKNSTPYHVTDERRSMFICAIMETAYTTALITVASLNDVFLGLLKNPFRLVNGVNMPELMMSTQPGLTTSNSAGAYRFYDDSESNAGHVVLRHSSHVSRTPSKLTAGAQGEANLQEETLIKNVRCYMTNQADVVNISTLVEAVLGSLRKSFPDCATIPTNNATYSRFVDECCRLAWQMSVADPPYYVTADATPGRRYDHRLHDTLMQTASGDYQLIDHYLWPVLFDRKHGTVLSKGRVELVYGSPHGVDPNNWSNSRF